jgi:hypothetical protein
MISAERVFQRGRADRARRNGVSRPTLTAVITAHDRRTFLPAAVRSAIGAGADEVIVVRNFSGPIEGCEGRYRDLPCSAAETTVKEALGVEAASGDLVGFLDDDDLWVPEKGAKLAELFEADPRLVYYCHAQSPIDESGRDVRARHPEFEQRRPKPETSASSEDFVRLVEHFPGNNSSTVVRREWALSTLEVVRDAGWAADLTWFATAALSGRSYRVGPERLTLLRLHLDNMSHAGGTTPEGFRAHHQLSSERFARSTGVLARVAAERAGPTSSIARYFAELEVAYRFFAELEAGRRPRRAALTALAHGPGLGNRGVTGSALVALGSPALARRLLYRSSQRRWSRG